MRTLTRGPYSVRYKGSWLYWPFCSRFGFSLEKNLIFQRIFLLLVLKCLKFNCLMLQSQKIKCLLLSRYPHSDPLTRACPKWVKWQLKTQNDFRMVSWLDILHDTNWNARPGHATKNVQVFLSRNNSKTLMSPGITSIPIRLEKKPSLRQKILPKLLSRDNFS